MANGERIERWGGTDFDRGSKDEPDTAARARSGEMVVVPGRRREDRSLLMKASEVAEMLGIGRSTVFVMMASGELPVVRIGRSVRVPRDALYGWIRERTVQSAKYTG